MYIYYMYLVVVTWFFFLLALVGPTVLIIGVYANWLSGASLQQALHHLIYQILEMVKYLVAVSCLFFFVLMSPVALIIRVSPNIVLWISGAFDQALHCDFIPYLLF